MYNHGIQLMLHMRIAQTFATAPSVSIYFLYSAWYIIFWQRLRIPLKLDCHLAEERAERPVANTFLATAAAW